MRDLNQLGKVSTVGKHGTFSKFGNVLNVLYHNLLIFL